MEKYDSETTWSRSPLRGKASISGAAGGKSTKVWRWQARIGLGLLRGASCLGHLIGADPSGIESAGGRQHGVERLVYVRIAATLESERIDACDHERSQVGAIEASLFQLLHCFGDSRVELEDPRRSLAPRFQCLGQRRSEPLLCPPEHRVIGATGKSSVLLIAKSDGEQRRLLEFDLEISLGSVFGLGQQLGESNDLQRALAQIVRLLGVEQQNPVSHLHVRYHDGHNRPGPRSEEHTSE